MLRCYPDCFLAVSAYGMQFGLQADQLRHLTKYFAKMMELQGAPLEGQSHFTAVT